MRFRPGLHHDVSLARRLLFGRPIETEQEEHARLPKVVALPVFASDAISSVAYASQQILLALGAAGLSAIAYRSIYTNLTLGLTAGIIFLLAVVVTSYWQTIYAYPSGGGSYIVSKDNIGVTAGLIAGSALLIDYVLTVAVSVASGIQNLLAVPVLTHLRGEQVLVGVLAIALLLLANLRGLKESGTVFAIPTYLFVGVASVMILLGLFAPLIGWQVHSETVNQAFPAYALREGTHGLGFAALLFLSLKAFANGCSAMTGTEAVSNGVPAFHRPESRNAALTLVAMACILAFLFGGISWLATQLHVVYWEHGHKTALPVIDQLSGAVFGKTGPAWRVTLYYTMQFSTAAILLLAANTAFADFPRLASILARDRFMPRQLAHVGDRLVFSNGIALLGALAMLLIILFHGSVDRLIPLYAVGVFTAFTLSQTGMVRHWLRLRTAGWRRRAAINGFGAICTGIVLADIVIEKFHDGAWLTVFLIGGLYALFRMISRHYEHLRSQLTIVGWRPEPKPFVNTVLLLVPSLHRGVFPALEYARHLSTDCRAIHIEIDPADTSRLRREWEEFVGDDVPLVILPSVYRSLVAPILSYLDEVIEEREGHVVTIVIPEFVSDRWWHSLLHNKNGLLLRMYLLRRPGVVVTNVRYFVPTGSPRSVEPGSGDSDASEEGKPPGPSSAKS